MNNSPVEPEGQRGTPSPKRPLGILIIAIIGLVVGIFLVSNGQRTPRADKPSSSTTLVEPALASLGDVANIAEAIQLVGRINPTTLPAKAGSASNSRVTMANVKRCGGAIAQQATDRTLGKRGMARQLRIGSVDALVVSYAMPASGKEPKGVRVVIADSKTCRVLGAIQS